MTTLTLRVTSKQRETLGPASRKVFDEAGGTIGRAPGNDWALPDPQRYVSSQHASVYYRDGAFYLRDDSKNGVFVNHSKTPLGNGNPVKLRDGDSLTMGDYEIAVSIAHPAKAELLPSEGQQETAPPFLVDKDSSIKRPHTPGPSDLGDLLQSSRTDERSDERQAYIEPEPPPAEPDHTPPLEEYFSPPKPVSDKIPDDWRKTEPEPEVEPPLEPPVEEPPLEPPVEEPPLEPPVEEPPVEEPPVPHPRPPDPSAQDKVEPASAPPPPVRDERGEEKALRAFLDGAGLDTKSLPEHETAQLMTEFGTIFREVVQGLMELLHARTSVKSEFRIGVTGIQRAGNNPLKFSASVEEVLEHLLLRPGRGYLPPVETIRDGLQGIKEHQWATIEGMRAALGAVLKRFDPKTLEQKFDTELGRAALLPGRRSKYWELYTAFHEAVLREAEDRFQILFGDEFARAYEEQIRALAQARKTPKE